MTAFPPRVASASRAYVGGPGPLEAALIKARTKSRLLGVPTEPVTVGRFELLRLIGRGSTSAVFEARDGCDGAVVALKLLCDRDPQTVARFDAEFHGRMGVAHDNLVELGELFSGASDVYFTMELVRGQPLTRFVRHAGSGSTPDSDQLRRVFAQLLSAVRALHAAGKLHCDLKPSNVLVTERERTVVLDFGLMIAMEQADRAAAAGRTAGTPAYMAPELHAGRAPSAASDAYAVGVMLFEALTGRLPGTAPGGRRVLELQGDGPADLNALCAALLEHEPSLRIDIAGAQHRLSEKSGS